jgi:predicted short-subunit dehydrogenase-like oxidoreductase (DUF2520 family)
VHDAGYRFTTPVLRLFFTGFQENVTFADDPPEMPQGTIRTVSIIGAGNVATALGTALLKKGVAIREVCNRTPARGQALAGKLGASFIADSSRLSKKTDLILISVSDDSLRQVVQRLRTGTLVVHTSGSLGIDLLNGVSDRTGVLYPLQTFRKGSRIPVRRIPFCIEAGGKKDELLLTELAGRLSGNVAVLDSRRRRLLHLAAVFASNFPNFLYSAAEELLRENIIPFGLLEPIILQTAGNARHADLFSLQTGPAVREDRAVMEKHRELLKDHPEYLRIYDLISKSIIQKKKRHGKL